VIGNSVRPEIFTANLLDPLVIRQEMSFVPSLPIVLIVGGGTGARALNRLMLEARPKLEEFCQLVHQTGGKVDTVTTSSHYRQLDFIDVADLARFYRVADLVVSRAGMGFITELSYLHKPSIIIPMPSSHQEANAQVLADAEAAVVLSESDLDADFLVDVIKKLLADNNARQELAVNIGQIIGQEANQKMLTIVEELAK
jgi:UDP-N-acetylglucosamine--N-acetylmuramyl-(pentapeptide) pyrophosphoryl-undecaprenol N-acetylglucosamine transferase